MVTSIAELIIVMKLFCEIDPLRLKRGISAIRGSLIQLLIIAALSVCTRSIPDEDDGGMMVCLGIQGPLLPYILSVKRASQPRRSVRPIGLLYKNYNGRTVIVN